jgi:hypothetical protein
MSETRISLLAVSGVIILCVIGIVLMLFLVLVASLGLGSFVHWLSPAVDKGTGALLGLISLLVTARVVWSLVAKIPVGEEDGEEEDTDDDDDDEAVLAPRDLMWLNQELSKSRRPPARRPRRKLRFDR